MGSEMENMFERTRDGRNLEKLLVSHINTSPSPHLPRSLPLPLPLLFSLTLEKEVQLTPDGQQRSSEHPPILRTYSHLFNPSLIFISTPTMSEKDYHTSDEFSENQKRLSLANNVSARYVPCALHISKTFQLTRTSAPPGSRTLSSEYQSTN